MNKSFFVQTKILDRIEINPQIMIGKPVIRGTRIPIYIILNLLANGYSFKRILKAYPDLTKEDIIACLNYSEFLAKYQEERVLAYV